MAVCSVWSVRMRIVNCRHVVFLMRTKRIKSQTAHRIPFVDRLSCSFCFPSSLSCRLIASGADAGIILNNTLALCSKTCTACHAVPCCHGWSEQANISAIENILLLRGAAQILSLKVPNRQVLLDSIFLRLLQTLVLNKRVIFLSFDDNVDWISIVG